MAESVKEKREARRQRRLEKSEAAAETESLGITEKKGVATPSRRKGETGIAKKEINNPVLRAFATIREYVEGVQSELQKVTWPTREETTRLTWIVGAVTLVSSLFLGGLSILFTEIFNLGVNSPWIFIGVFVAFLGILYAYSQFVRQGNASDI